MSEKIWHYELNSEQKGPVSVDQIEALVEAGVLTAHSKVWSESLDGWSPMFKTELRVLIKDENVSPPPLPDKPVSSQDNFGGSAKISPSAPYPPVSSGFRDISTLSMIIKITFIALGVWWIFAGLAILGESSRSQKALIYWGLNYNDGILLIEGLVMLTAVVAFLMWTFRLAHNAQYFSGQNLKITPGWSVGWYFVPIANLWMPLQSVTQIWLASGGHDSKRGLVNLWWWLFIGANIIQILSVILAESPGATTGAYDFFAVTSFVMAASAFVAVNFVGAMTKLQMQAQTEL